MDPSLVNQIVVAAATLLASLGGYLLAGRNERRRDERTLQRELRVRNLERGTQLEAERHGLQRETLLELQDAVQAMARVDGRTMHFDHMQAREGKYAPLPADLDEDGLAALVQVRRLASRVLDSHVRDAVDEFIELPGRLGTLPNYLKGLSGDSLENAALSKLKEFKEGYDAVSRILGEAARGEIAWQPAEPAEPIRAKRY